MAEITGEHPAPVINKPSRFRRLMDRFRHTQPQTVETSPPVIPEPVSQIQQVQPQVQEQPRLSKQERKALKQLEYERRKAEIAQSRRLRKLKPGGQLK